MLPQVYRIGPTYQRRNEDGIVGLSPYPLVRREALNEISKVFRTS